MTRSFLFYKVQYLYLIYVLIKNSLPAPRLWRYFTVAIIVNFIFKPIKFIYIIQLILIFVYGGGRGQHAFFLMYVCLIKPIPFISHISLSTLPWHFCQKLSNWVGIVCIWSPSYSIGLFTKFSANTILSYLLQLLMSGSVSAQDVFYSYSSRFWWVFGGFYISI